MTEAGFEPRSFLCLSKYSNHSATEVDCAFIHLCNSVLSLVFFFINFRILLSTLFNLPALRGCSHSRLLRSMLLDR